MNIRLHAASGPAPTDSCPAGETFKADPVGLARVLAWIRGLRDFAKITPHSRLHVRGLLRWVVRMEEEMSWL